MLEQPVGVGILGAGRPNIATSNQVPACQASDHVRLVALCDRLESVHEIARENNCTSYTDYNEMLADSAVEMVQVATPDWCHVEHAEAALANGKHVLLQKPPCIDAEGLAKLRRAVAESSARLKVLLNTRQTRLSRTIRRELDAGTIGDPVHVRISYRGHRYPIDDPESPYLQKRLGGVWIHNGLHWLDEALFYSGSLPVTTHVITTRNDNGSPAMLGEGPNYWHGRFTMASGSTVALEYNTMLMQEGLPGGMERVIIGTRGELRQSYDSDALLCYQVGREEPVAVTLEDAECSSLEDINESFRRAIDAFALEIRDGREREPRRTDSLRCMEALIVGAAHANAQVLTLQETSQGGVE